MNLASVRELRDGMSRAEVDEVLAAGRRAVELNRKLSESDPSVPAHLTRLVGTWCNLGLFQDQLGQPADAEASYRSAIEAGERLVHTFPAERTGRLFLGQSHMNLAELLLRTRGAAAARASYVRCRDLYHSLIVDGKDPINAGKSLGAAGYRLMMMDLEAGRYKEAEAWCRGTLPGAIEALRAKPEVVLLPPRMTQLAMWGSGHRDLARTLEPQGRAAEVVAWCDRGISIMAEAARREPRDRFVPTWLAETRDMRYRALARLRSNPIERILAVPLPPVPPLVMPSGTDAFARPSR